MVLAFSILILGLVACGGGAGGNSTPVTPPGAATLNVAFTLKQLQFTWATVSTANTYRLQQSLDGTTFTQVGGDLASTATNTALDIGVAGVNWAALRFALDACNSVGCTRSNVVTINSGMLSAIGYLKASNTRTNGNFGGNVALSRDGNTLAVGAPGEASNATGINGNQGDVSAPQAGAVYVFTRSGSTWSQQAYLKASNTEAGDQFGAALSLSSDGNTLAVAAPFEDSNATSINGNQANNSAPQSGAVYLFTRSANIWSQLIYVKASNTGTGDQFGTSISLSDDGSRLAVGAPGEASNGILDNQADNSAPQAGAVYVFTLGPQSQGGAWFQDAYLKASNPEAFDLFGMSVAIGYGTDSTLAVGAPGEASNATGIDGNQADNSAPQAGAVYLFSRTKFTWDRRGYVKAPNPDSSDLFGTAVALINDGNTLTLTLAVGAPGEASSATGINGNQANNSAPAAGAVYVFTINGGVLNQQVYVKASNTESADSFGTTVAFSSDGNTLAVGAPFESSNATGINGNQANNSTPAAGAAYVFTRSGTTWSQQAYVKASNTGASDQFATRIALSGDGSTLAVGAFAEDSNATGINGNQADNSAAQSGAVYLF
ncbi:MAG TPA: hypothetical protein VG892_10435 [Terriglobales bacterium]|nr:hypothetical protein [Terriglobales bacterium]